MIHYNNNDNNAKRHGQNSTTWRVGENGHKDRGQPTQQGELNFDPRVYNHPQSCEQLCRITGHEDRDQFLK